MRMGYGRPFSDRPMKNSKRHCKCDSGLIESVPKDVERLAGGASMP